MADKYLVFDPRDKSEVKTRTIVLRDHRDKKAFKCAWCRRAQVEPDFIAVYEFRAYELHHAVCFCAECALGTVFEYIIEIEKDPLPAWARPKVAKR